MTGAGRGLAARNRVCRLRAGSVCIGYGGLDLAVAAVLGAALAWCAETDRHASAVLAARFPGVPNQSPQVRQFRRALWREPKEMTPGG